MNLTSKKTSLLILAITAIVCSHVMFLFFNDPEGPNLLIVIGMAVVVYFLSLVAYLFNISGSKKLLLAILIQIVIAVALYFCLS
jgi:hypothetical protein